MSDLAHVGGGGGLNLPTPGTIAKQLIGYLEIRSYIDNSKYWDPPPEYVEQRKKALLSNYAWMAGHTAINTLALGYASKKLLGACCLKALAYGFGGAMVLNGVMYAVAVREEEASRPRPNMGAKKESA